VHALDIAEAKFTLGRLPPGAFSEVGVSLLEAGLDSEAIRSLAALREDEAPSEGPELFRLVLTELGRNPLPREDGLRLYLCVVSRQILAGEVSPCEGVRQLWTEASEAHRDGDSWDANPANPGELLWFIGLTGDCETPWAENAIRAVATRTVERYQSLLRPREH
jgi:hypothetical protein